MKRFSCLAAFAVVAASLTPPPSIAQTITLGQIDTFESGTTLNWSIGSPIFTGPTVQPNGPGGINDHYLELISGQANGPPRFVMFNDVQWTGNYNSPSPPGSNPVNAIEMDIANFSATFLASRIVLKSGVGNTSGYAFSGGPGTNGAIDIPADGGVWHHVVYPLNSATLTPINAPLPLSEFLNNVGEVRILHSMLPSVVGDGFVGRVGIDNVHAIFLPVPEPACILTAAALVGLVGVPARRWYQQRGSRRTASAAD